MSSNSGHPAWQELLAKIPESLHPIVEPVLKEWDQGVQQTLQAKTEELKKLEPYKQFLDNNIDAEWLVEAADFAYRAQENPKELFEHANRVWNLGFVSPEEAASSSTSSAEKDDDLDPELEDVDITQHPQFKALAEQINALTGQVTEFTESQSTEKQQKEWDDFLKKQHDEGKQFNDDFVTALVANGLNFEDAVDKYNELVASVVGSNDESTNKGQAGQEDNSSTDTAPVVMGGSGSGSGLPEQTISFGKMKDGDLEDTVAQMIAAMNSSDS